MSRDELIDGLKSETSDSSVRATMSWLRKPAGRQPARRKVELSEWFNNLPDSDKTRVEQIVRESAELAIFSFLALLDGVAFIEQGEEKGRFELHYYRGGERLLVNDPQGEYLHDIYNSKLRTS